MERENKMGLRREVLVGFVRLLNQSMEAPVVTWILLCDQLLTSSNGHLIIACLVQFQLF